MDFKEFWVVPHIDVQFLPVDTNPTTCKAGLQWCRCTCTILYMHNVQCKLIWRSSQSCPHQMHMVPHSDDQLPAVAPCVLFDWYNNSHTHNHLGVRCSSICNDTVPYFMIWCIFCILLRCNLLCFGILNAIVLTQFYWRYAFHFWFLDILHHYVQ